MNAVDSRYVLSSTRITGLWLWLLLVFSRIHANQLFRLQLKLKTNRNLAKDASFMADMHVAGSSCYGYIESKTN